ncbi:MAG: ABC transporter permease [Bdellovibrionaceae bacterium]|nr:ABC transporter permease [Pseudobdellovibrionaceae bacterium]
MIKITNLKKHYQMGNQLLEILKGIDLVIEDGEFIAIMGPSGSGKSTLMNILGLLDVPSSGTYALNTQEISQMSEDELASVRRNEIGFIFQQFNLLPRVTAEENVSLPLLYSKKFLGSGRAMELLSSVGLASRSHHKPNELSGGQQQRVAIARSLINNPRMILADEPTGNLDSQSQHEIMSILKDLNAQGITVVIVTHEEEVAQEAKRIIRIKDGRVFSDSLSSSKKPEYFEVADSSQAVPQVRMQDKAMTQNNLITFKSTKAITKEMIESSSLRDFYSYFTQGFKTLMANKVRTFLSMLGILIGVGAVVAMLALGKGAQKAIEEQLSSLGSNLIMVRPGNIRVGGISQESGAANRLMLEDLSVISKKVDNIKGLVGQVSGRGQLTAQSKNWNTTVQGVSSVWFRVHNSEPKMGRIYSDDEDIKRVRVALIGETVKRELFGDGSPIGEMIKINKINFQVIGVLPEKGGNSFRDQDDVVIIPLQTAMKRLFGRTYLDMIEVEMLTTESIGPAINQMTNVLTELHKIPLSQQSEAFQIRNMADIQQAMQQSSETMSLLLAAIATISLLVGGIGIMNIMLVSVTERTREIGLRKAIGAHRKDILFQFLSESIVVSVVGGLLGIFLGWTLTALLSAVLGWNTVVSLNSVLVSFCFSAMIGVIFGVYPARKAALLNPIEALRYE